ncbi:hypothetical protein PENTCL1PPCAC_6601 [Pristionchus entomophagus]|uniref:Ubiquitin carboxyl-terminal hydrolase n=1 Tax=Pristionchus entomophagus TaxID=358040 RepID=A0AAV5SY20_9BILA|nr:hypothetical protein PENTCL1PPCAC_6601 [Pristionchus entomophagus]
MTSKCVHLTEGRAKKELSKYEALLSHLVFPSDPSRTFKKRAFQSCRDCDGESDLRDCRVMISACLECPTYYCLTHLLPHLRDAKHPFAMSLETGYIYCLRCGDFVYDRLLEGMRMDSLNKLRGTLGLSVVSSWNPSDEDLVRLARSKSMDGGAIRARSVNYTGPVRGMVNMGNTCFMNCILQSLLHSPSLRDFFLSHHHRCNMTPPNSCLVCEMQNAFQFFYNGTNRYSFVPSTMLHTVWTRSSLTGYSQHDAHEFFITAMEMLHKDSRSDDAAKNASLIHSSRDCKCIVDQLFTGELQSDLRCFHCGNVSTKVDPCWDISLNLPQGERELSLERCLEGYVCSEVLDSSFPCSNCRSEGLCKQLSFLKTPVICVFHLKRFEHDTHLRKKMTTRVTFAEKLDMSPYTTSYRNQPHLFDYSRGSTAHINRRSYEYTLFAVVQHEGSLDSGHYTAFVRSYNTWYLCDDERIRAVPIEKVLAAEAYILFYHSTHIKFK